MTTLDAHLLALDMKTGAIVVGRDAGRLQERATPRRSRRSSSRTRSSSASPAASTASAASSTPTTRRPASAPGASTRFPVPASRATTRGPAIRGRRGGAGVWVTGAYDPELNLVYYGTGNPGPDYHSDSREGRQPLQRLARRARRRHRQAALALPVHAARRARLGLDAGADPRRPDHRRPAAQGRDVRQPQRLLLHARSGHRQGDRRASRSSTTTWAKEIGTRRPADAAAGPHARRKGRAHLPRHHRRHQLLAAVATIRTQRLFFVNAREVCATYYAWKPEYHAGRSLHRRRRAARARRRRSRPTARCARSIRRPASASGSSSYLTPSTAGLLTTASGLIFSGDNEGNLLALDSRTGKLLWRYQMGANLHGTSPTTYMLDGRQHLLVPAGTTLTAWALARRPPRATR